MIRFSNCGRLSRMMRVCEHVSYLDIVYTRFKYKLERNQRYALDTSHVSKGTEVPLVNTFLASLFYRKMSSLRFLN